VHLDELIELARSSPEYTDRGAVTTADEISRLGTALGVTFPESYAYFLKVCGFALWDGGRIAGIGDRFLADCLSATLLTRSDEFTAGGFKPPPKHTVWVGTAGDGDCFLFCQGSPRCGEVTCVDVHYRRGGEVEFWKSFEDFFEWQLLNTDNSVVVADFSEYEA
jgi:hypothetical protein